MIWLGEEVNTVDELIKAVEYIAEKNNPEMAQNFLAQYKEETEHAEENIGYVAGYFKERTFRTILTLFNVDHPVFGRDMPTPAEAFHLGQMEAMKRVAEEKK